MSLNSLNNTFQANSSSDIYTDLNGLKNLKTSARKDAQGALPEVARQFEAVMLTMMIKGLRKTGMEDPIFKSQAMDSYRDMYDQQLGMELSKGQGIGLAQTIAAQMQYQAAQNITPSGHHQASELTLPERRNFPDRSVKNEQNLSSESTAYRIESKQETLSVSSLFSTNRAKAVTDKTFKSPEQFVEKLWPLAEKAAKELGVSPQIILSQSALETGWGQHIINHREKSSFNLFNIKANSSWPGQRMEKVSMEFILDKNNESRPIEKKSDFRVYDSYEQSFADYVNVVKNNQRYAIKPEQSLHDEPYIKALQAAGYATDPVYSEKVMRVLKSAAIQNQLKLQQSKEV